MLFLLTTKAVRANNEHGEWCVSREALSRVRVRTGQGEGRRERERGCEKQMMERKTGRWHYGGIKKVMR